MPEVVAAAGLLVTALSLFLFLRPRSLAGILDRVFATRWRYAAALLRLLLGATLIASADTVAYSRAIGLFGWLAVLGALALVVVPAPALRRIAGWFGALSPALSRVWLSLALVFGLFLLYAALA